MTYRVNDTVSETRCIGRVHADICLDLQDSWAPTRCIAIWKRNVLGVGLAYGED